MRRRERGTTVNPAGMRGDGRPAAVPEPNPGLGLDRGAWPGPGGPVRGWRSGRDALSARLRRARCSVPRPRHIGPEVGLPLTDTLRTRPTRAGRPDPVERTREWTTSAATPAAVLPATPVDAREAELTAGRVVAVAARPGSRPVGATTVIRVVLRDDDGDMSSPSCVDVRLQGDGRMTSGSLGVHLTASGIERVNLDLTTLSFIDPAGLVTLAAVAERAAEAGRAVAVTAPADPDLATYLARMRFGEVLNRLGIAHDLRPVTEHDTGARLVELRRFEDPAGLDAVIAALVQTYLTAEPDRLQPLYAALGEIGANVIQHSGKSHGHVALQRFPRTGVVEFAVGDSGVGLRTSLRQSRAVEDDRVAVTVAAQRHESSLPAPGRGQGISRVIETAWAHNGTVRLVSGSATGLFGRSRGRPQLTDLRVPLPGTVVHVRLSLEGAAS